jgi:hypothetical protein
MGKRTKLIVATGALALAVGVGTYVFQASSQEGGPGFGPGFGHGFRHGFGHGFGRGFMHRVGPGGMGMRHGMMGAGPISATAGEMGDIHELLDNHDRIRRTVVNLPNGIRTVTESDDPRIAQIIKEHVASMGARVSAGKDPGLPIETPALHAIFKYKDKITTTVETTAKGSIVVQTSSDPQTVAVLQKHAAEVSDLVRGAMPALHTAMHGRMTRGKPFDEDEPDGR